MKKNNYNKLLDIVRAFAIISVVFCHSVEMYYYAFQDRSITWINHSFISRIFDLIGISFGRLGVPMFLFLTGILICKKVFKSFPKDIKHFYKTKYFSLFLTLEIWIIIWNGFALLLCLWRGEIPFITFSTFLQNIFLLKTVDYMMPAWYAPMILGVYLFLPFISILIKKIDIKSIRLPLLVSIVACFLLPTINEILSISNFSLYTDIDLSFSGGTYGIYIILGYYIYQNILKKFSNLTVCSIFIISFMSCVIMSYSLSIHGYFYKLSYSNILLLIASCFLFEIFRRLFNKSENNIKFITYLSKISFPIFLLHNIIQYVIYQLNIFSAFLQPFAVICSFFLTMIICIIIIKILSLNKYLKKYLLKMS